MPTHRATGLTKPPNFLIFVTDQQRADHLGCYGNQVVRTPHIDALAATGSRFERSYVANPVCMPNRGSMLTGRMPSIHGCRGNGVPLPLEAVTFADVLGEFGYHTALIGKSHLQNMEDLPPVLPPQAARAALASSAHFPEATRRDIAASAYAQELRSSWNDPAHRLTLPYYGFQDVVLCNHHADECFGDYSRWLAAEHADVADRVGRQHGLRDPGFVAPQAWRTRLSEHQYPTHFVAEQSCRWLEDHVNKESDQPFLLVCSFPDPHHPWTPPGKYWDMYDPDQISVPRTASASAPHERHVQWLWDERQSGKANVEGPRIFATTEREIREITALTYGMISNVDDRIGMVMAKLRACGADANTVVVFTSDHGDLMGDHGLMLKGPAHYQGLVRVPLIWREPAGSENDLAAVRTDLASSMDLATSVLARAGIAAPNGMQGKALFDPTGLPSPSQREAVLIEENQQRAYMGFDTPVRVRTLVTKSHRLSVFHESDWGELYDLDADPLEEHNLWDAPGAQQSRCSMLDLMVRTLIAHAEASPRPTRLA